MTKFTLFRPLTAAVALLATTLTLSAELNKLCPIMVEDEADPEKTVEFKGVKIALCCGKCEKAFKDEKAAAYYVAAATKLGLLPQCKGKEAELGLDKIKLLPQTYCAINHKTLITPESPSIEYKGQKIYFFNEKAIERWNKDPEAAAKKAIEAGVLPQLQGK